MTLSDELTWRGFVNQTTLKAITELDLRKFAFYWGVDPSADSMTVGHLAIAMMVRHFIEHGHQAFLLVGGATGMVGDPDGKKQERDLLSIDELNANKAAIEEQYKQIFSGQKFKVVDNYEWFKDLGYLDFLREIGKHASLTQMLDRDFIKTRIGEGGSGISYAEFSYSLIQGYDFLHLLRKYGVSMQVCGADQWGNSITGVDLIRKLESKEAHVFSAPLVINKSTGVKFGKTEAGAVWLDESKTSVFRFYQFWLNADDESVIDYLKLYTMLAKSAIDTLAKSTKAQPQLRSAQKALAYDVTKTVHGEKRAKAVQASSEVLFGSKPFSDLALTDIEELAKELPPVTAGSVVEALVKGGLAGSNSEAHRFVQSGAVSINGKKVAQESDLANYKKNRGHLLIKRGKNSFALIK